MISPSEFYTKYWKITMLDGSIISPPPLSEKECFFMDEIWGNSNVQGIIFGRTRKRTVFVDIEQMKKDMNKLPEFIKQQSHE
jgi:hypothetical protein